MPIMLDQTQPYLQVCRMYLVQIPVRTHNILRFLEVSLNYSNNINSGIQCTLK
jgi:hypothetical protein